MAKLQHPSLTEVLAHQPLGTAHVIEADALPLRDLLDAVAVHLPGQDVQLELGRIVSGLQQAYKGLITSIDYNLEVALLASMELGDYPAPCLIRMVEIIGHVVDDRGIGRAVGGDEAVIAGDIAAPLMNPDPIVQCLPLIVRNAVITGKLVQDLLQWLRQEQAPTIPG